MEHQTHNQNIRITVCDVLGICIPNQAELNPMILLELCEVGRNYCIYLLYLITFKVPDSPDHLLYFVLQYSFQGNLENYLHKNAVKFKNNNDVLGWQLNQIGRYSCETLLKFSYQVTSSVLNMS